MKKVYGASNKGYRWSTDGKYWRIGGVSNKGGSSALNVLDENGDAVVGGGGGGSGGSGSGGGGDRVVITKDYIFFIDLRSKFFSYREIEDKVLIVINELFAPYLYEKYFDLSHGLYQNLGDRLTFKTGKKHDYYLLNSDEINRYERFTSIIDWNRDCEMQPITSITYAELLKLNLVEDFPIYDFNMIKDTEKLKEFIEKIKTYFNKRKAKFLGEMVETIDSITGDDEALIDSSDSQQEINDILEFKDKFETALKDGSKAVAQKLADALFSYDDSLIKKILISTMYEILQSLAQQLKFLFLKINREVYQIINANDFYLGDRGGQFYWNENDSRVFWNDYGMAFAVFADRYAIDFNRALNIATNKYLQKVAANIEKINDNKDRNIIEFASGYFKSKRSILQEEAFKCLNKADKTPDYIRCFLQDSIIYLKQELKLYFSNTIGLINQLTLLESFIKDIYNTYFYNASEYNDITMKLIKSSYQNTMRNFNNELNLITLKYDDDLKQFPQDEKERAIKYLNEIRDKFIDRCKELLHVIFYQTSEEIKNQQVMEIYNTDKSEMKKILNEFLKEVLKHINDYELDFYIFVDNYNFKNIEYLPKYSAKKYLENICNEYSFRKGIL